MHYYPCEKISCENNSLWMLSCKMMNDKISLMKSDDVIFPIKLNLSFTAKAKQYTKKWNLMRSSWQILHMQIRDSSKQVTHQNPNLFFKRCRRQFVSRSVWGALIKTWHIVMHDNVPCMYSVSKCLQLTWHRLFNASISCFLLKEQAICSTGPVTRNTCRCLICKLVVNRFRVFKWRLFEYLQYLVLWQWLRRLTTRGKPSSWVTGQI